MIQYFFSPHIFKHSTTNLFDNLAITNIDNGKYIKEYMGKYPVIFLSFKDVKEKTYEGCLQNLNILIQNLYFEHEYLLESTKLSTHNKKRFQEYLTNNPTPQHLAKSVRILSELLYQHYNQKVYILIDEYCTPLSDAYLYDYINELSTLIRNIMSNALKDNTALQKGILTGILRISKDGILSGLNNLKVFSVLDKKYNDFFGFTDEDVDYLFHHQNLDQYKDNAKLWYDGYNFNGVKIYNPWSILSCLFEGGTCNTDWLNTADQTIITQLLNKFRNSLSPKLAELLEHGETSALIDKNITHDTMLNSVSSYWTLLLFSGYLTATYIAPSNSNHGTYYCKLSVPNREILNLFYNHFSQEFNQQLDNQSDIFLDNLINGNVDIFTKQLQQYLTNLISNNASLSSPFHHNTTATFYYTLFLGLIVSLKKTHAVHSTPIKDSEFPNISILPLATTPLDLGIILSFKNIHKNNGSLEALAEQALAQIDSKYIENQLTSQPNIKKILKTGFAINSINHTQLKAKWQWEKCNQTLHP